VQSKAQKERKGKIKKLKYTDTKGSLVHNSFNTKARKEVLEVDYQ